MDPMQSERKQFNWVHNYYLLSYSDRVVVLCKEHRRRPEKVIWIDTQEPCCHSMFPWGTLFINVLGPVHNHKLYRDTENHMLFWQRCDGLESQKLFKETWEGTETPSVKQQNRERDTKCEAVSWGRNESADAASLLQFSYVTELRLGCHAANLLHCHTIGRNQSRAITIRNYQRNRNPEAQAETWRWRCTRPGPYCRTVWSSLR